MKKRLSVRWFSPLVFGAVLLSSTAFSKDMYTFQVAEVQGDRPRVRIFDLQRDGQASKVINIDPNFPTKEPNVYNGRRLSSFARSGAADSAITVIAKDQYVFSGSKSFLDKYDATVATSENDRPITATKGGPSRLIFARRQVQEDFVWYVKGAVVGDFASYSLLLKANGKQILLPFARIVADETVVKSVFLPWPRGGRPESLERPKPFRGLGATLRGLAASVGRPDAKIALATDLVGNQRRLPLGNGAPEFIVVCSKDGTPLSVAAGGPCLVTPTAENAGDGPFFFLDNLEFE